MRKTTLICDRCGKEVAELFKFESNMSYPQDSRLQSSFELCSDCVGELRRFLES